MNARLPAGVLEREAAVEEAVHRDYFTENGSFSATLVEDALRAMPRELIQQLAAATKGYGLNESYEQKKQVMYEVGGALTDWLIKTAYEQAEENLKEA